MAPKREREEDEHPVAERGGAGIEEAAGGHVLTIEAMMERINELQEMIVVKETAQEMKESKLKEDLGRSVQEALEKYRGEQEKVSKLESIIKAQAEARRNQLAAQTQAQPQQTTTTNSSAEIKALEKQLGEKSTQLTTEQRIVATLRKRISELENPAGVAPVTAPAPPAQPQEPQVPKAQLEASRKLFRQRIHEKDQELEKLQKKYDNLDEDFEELNREVEDLNEQAKELNETIDLDRAQIAELKAKNKEISDSAQLARHQATAIRTHLEQEVENLKDKITYLNLDISLAAADKDVLQNQVDQLKAAAPSAELTDQVSHLNNQVSDLHDQIADLTKKLDDEVKKVEDEHYERRGAEVALELRRDSWNQTEKDLKRQISALKDEAKRLNAVIAGRTANDQATDRPTTNNLGDEVAKLQRIIAAQTAEIANGEKAKKALTRKVEEVRKTALKRIESEKAKTSHIESEAKYYHREAAQFEEAAEHYYQETLELRREINRIKSQVQVPAPAAVPAARPALSFSRIEAVSTAPVVPRPTTPAAATTSRRPAPTTPSPPAAPTNQQPSLSLPPSPPPSLPRPSQYELARQDVPDTDTWWFDPTAFDNRWQPHTFVFRRTRPFCDDCRTRRALRLVNGEWKLPEGFSAHRRDPCAEHAKPWYPPAEKAFWRKPQWHPQCADCIETDSRESGEEDKLPQQLRESLACRDHGCQWVAHDRVEAEARFVLAEHGRKQEEREAASLRHEQHLAQYRAVYGSGWPLFKGGDPPKNFGAQ